MTQRVPFVILGISVPKVPNYEVIDASKQILIKLWAEHPGCLQNVKMLLNFLCQKLDEMKNTKSLSDAMQVAYTAVAKEERNGYKAYTNIIFNKSVKQVDNWDEFMEQSTLQEIASTVVDICMALAGLPLDRGKGVFHVPGTTRIPLLQSVKKSSAHEAIMKYLDAQTVITYQLLDAIRRTADIHAKEIEFLHAKIDELKLKLEEKKKFTPTSRYDIL